MILMFSPSTFGPREVLNLGEVFLPSFFYSKTINANNVSVI